MKKLFKNVKYLMNLNYFKSYRILITENVIEVKLNPKSDKEKEIVYSMKHTKHNIGFLSRSLESEFEKYKNF